ncbi:MULTISPECIES: hypothetical protein [Methylopilaceae]|uniref:Uncharacterized protein n=2 Tax=Methylopilaceae TaxID=3149309 RepID=A0A4V1KI99_9HYPH|nr:MULTISPECIES: hypothetical protein [Methylocystaceae]QZO00584.1 hypothetical protein K6K41_02340 [Chenggangzhangella methanolivorans]RXF69952.1 hypothetical protein EK403_17625 [Hansschlegelia zhihuaiae]
MRFLLSGYGYRSKVSDGSKSYRTLRGRMGALDESVEFRKNGISTGAPAFVLKAKTSKTSEYTSDNDVEIVLFDLKEHEVLDLAAKLVDYATFLHEQRPGHGYQGATDRVPAWASDAHRVEYERETARAFGRLLATTITYEKKVSYINGIMGYADGIVAALARRVRSAGIFEKLRQNNSPERPPSRDFGLWDEALSLAERLQGMVQPGAIERREERPPLRLVDPD